MRQAITTKYLGATDHRGSRIKATSGSGHSLTLSWDHALNSDENHIAAARALAAKLKWSGKWSGGGTRDGYAFVMSEEGFTV